jgi:hypothetical protein
MTEPGRQHRPAQLAGSPPASSHQLTNRPLNHEPNLEKYRHEDYKDR